MTDQDVIDSLSRNIEAVEAQLAEEKKKADLLREVLTSLEDPYVRTITVLEELAEDVLTYGQQTSEGWLIPLWLRNQVAKYLKPHVQGSPGTATYLSIIRKFRNEEGNT